MIAMFKPKKLTGNSGGFTLLEVIIAMAIMVLAFSSILAVEMGSIRASDRAKQMNIVSMLAKNQMVEMEYLIQGKNFEEIGKEENGTFEAPYEDYRWKRTVKELKFPALNTGGGGEKKPGENKATDDSAAGNQMTEMITKLISNYFSKAIREINVTVSWKRGSTWQTYTLSTYWVNLNHEFTMSE